MEKAITIQQPYAFLECAGIKNIENRTWKTKFRGRVYIHAGVSKKIKHKLNKAQMLDIERNGLGNKVGLITGMIIKPDYDNTPNYGAIIGYVNIIDCVENHPSVWALPNHYHWVLDNPILFGKPIIGVKGKLSFWDCSKYIHSEIDEDGKPICMCNLGIDEKDQVSRFLGDEFRCRYCGGKWYK